MLLVVVVAAFVASAPAEAHDAAEQPTTTLRPPPPDAAPSRVFARKGSARGMDEVNTTFTQIAAGAGACCVGSVIALPLSLIPVVGPFVGEAVAGALIGGTEAVVGDVVSKKRAGLLLPLGVGAAISVGGVVGATIWDASVPAADNVLASAPVGDSTVVVTKSVFITAGATVLAVVVPAVIWQLTADDKAAGDDGGGLPGLLGPAGR